MRKGLDVRRVKFSFFVLVGVAGTLFLYSWQTPADWSNAFSRQQLRADDKRCSSSSPDIYDFVVADEITIQMPVLPHKYRSDGLLQVSPSAPHPIHDLIAEAENKWQVKHNVASKNIAEAFYEYQRRYGRLPPRGFDKWWEYVQEHNVQLPDSYDQIWLDLEPFWGMDPAELQRIREGLEAQPESFTLGKVAGEPITIVNQSLTKPELLRGSEGILSLLRPIEEHLLPFRAVVSPLDNPYGLIDFEAKQATLRAAKAKKRLMVKDLPSTPPRGWMMACPEDQKHNDTLYEGYTKKTFIHDHGKTMDPCLHPDLLEIHGQFLSYGGHPPLPDRPMVPKFAYCSTTLHSDIRIPHLLSWVEDIYPQEHNPDWDDRPDERLAWRGSNTGMWQTAENRWKESQRPRAVEFAAQMEGEVDVLFPPLKRDDPVGTGMRMAKSKLNPALFDIAFAGSPLQCPDDYCNLIEDMFDWRKFQDAKGAAKFKYALDIDGNAWSSRFQRLMVSNTLVLKATIYPEWFFDRIQPWVHYVPVQVDLSDLYDALVFFRGDAYGAGSHHDLARKIAHNSRKWAKEFWRKEDMTAYAFRLMLEYARVMSPERDSMVFTI